MLTVTVVDRDAMAQLWGTAHYRVIVRTVEISDRCRLCGGPRGTPVSRPFYEDGESYAADCWKNPCGHVDLYQEVLAEAKWMQPVKPNR